MNELDKLTLDYMAKRLAIMQDKKFLEIQKEVVNANTKMIEYLKTQIPEEMKNDKT